MIRHPWVDASLADRIVSIGSVAVFLHEYQSEDGALGRAAGGLRAWSHPTGRPALYHPASALYGLLDLPPDSAHRVHVVDPAKRFLPRALLVEVRDREIIRAQLRAGGDAPHDPHPVYTQAPMRPAIDYPFKPGDTVVWGVVTDKDGLTVAYARVMVDSAGEQVATWTDLNGVYVVHLRKEAAEFNLPDSLAEPSDVDPDDETIDSDPPLDLSALIVTQFTRDFTFYRPKQAVDRTRDTLLQHPERFDEMTASAAVRNAYYRAGEPHSASIEVGRRTRVDFQFTS